MYNLRKEKTLESNDETALEYVEKNEDVIDMPQVKGSQETHIFDEEVVREKTLKRHNVDNISIRELAKEIKISAPTLSRFCNKQTKRLSANAVKKISKWYERQVIIEKMQPIFI